MVALRKNIVEGLFIEVIWFQLKSKKVAKTIVGLYYWSPNNHQELEE